MTKYPTRSSLKEKRVLGFTVRGLHGGNRQHCRRLHGNMSEHLGLLTSSRLGRTESKGEPGAGAHLWNLKVHSSDPLPPTRLHSLPNNVISQRPSMQAYQVHSHSDHNTSHLLYFRLILYFLASLHQLIWLVLLLMFIRLLSYLSIRSLCLPELWIHDRTLTEPTLGPFLSVKMQDSDSVISQSRFHELINTLLSPMCISF